MSRFASAAWLAAWILAVSLSPVRAEAQAGATGPVDALDAPLQGLRGEAARGREIALSREKGNCLLCHAFPDPAYRVYGDLGPDLAGIGSLRTPGQLRLRLVDASLSNPETLMPSYYRREGFERVASAWKGRTVLEAQEIEDVLAYLLTLR